MRDEFHKARMASADLVAIGVELLISITTRDA